jgi:hypothetical protein
MGEDPGKQRQIAEAIVGGAGQIADRGLAFRERIEFTQRRLRSTPRAACSGGGATPLAGVRLSLPRPTKCVSTPLARAAREELGWIAIERKRRDIAQIAECEADIGQFPAVHCGERPQPDPRRGNPERPSRRSTPCDPKPVPKSIFASH